MNRAGTRRANEADPAAVVNAPARYPPSRKAGAMPADDRCATSDAADAPGSAGSDAPRCRSGVSSAVGAAPGSRSGAQKAAPAGPSAAARATSSAAASPSPTGERYEAARRAGSIRALPALLVNQIAAGEVIERPASVVKELVENAIDAGANRIRVTIEQGGKELIEITDDGCGIPRDELPLALAPHATSKIGAQEDLDAISTLGFRGEALASITSVSRMTIVSRPRSQDSAFRIRAEGEIEGAVEPCPGPPGTTITVRNLFFATPARRKFLRTPQTEYNHINDLIQRLAMSHPAIGFTLVHDGKVKHDLRPNQLPRDRVFDIIGREMQDEFLEVDAHDGGSIANLTMWGMLGSPSIARGHAKAQHVFLNGRFVRDKTIMHAIKEAYRGLLDPSKYPTAVLYIEMNPAFVDVNVHPTKAEVRFRDGQHVHGFILNNLRDVLRRADLTPAVQVRQGDNRWRPNAHGSGPGSGPTNAAGPSVADRRFAEFFRRVEPGSGGGGAAGTGRLAGFDYQSVRDGLQNPQNANPIDVTSGMVPPAGGPHGPAGGMQNAGSLAQHDGLNHHSPDALHDINNASGPDAATHYAAVNGAGPQAGTGTGVTADGGASEAYATPLEARIARALQVHGSYLVVEEDDGISIVDQHALHERVMFEQLRNRILSQGELESQRLLMPAPVDVTSSSRMELFEQLGPLLRRLGIEADAMGPRQIAVHAFPSFLFERNVDPIEFMTDLIDLAERNGTGLTADSSDDDGEAALHEVLDMMSCKAAVKAGDHLTPDEVTALLNRRHEVDRAGRCPHGRPTTIRLSLHDLERQFGRR
ncbi:MAG: DNA mismatch repair endonuclease MutL [Planctomycetota bacterium]